jgi:ubiquinone/menaquinone biosynthesis C-methylase UbiE
MLKKKGKARIIMFRPTMLRPERASTYFVQDRFNEEELTRLQIQDREITRTTCRRVLEQLAVDPTAVQGVLDVGCGTGGWLLEMAKMYPGISSLAGIDINTRVLEYAQAQAEAQQISQRVRFQVMDALRVLDFPAQSFDLVHQRFGNSYLRRWDWPQLLSEYWRVSQPGGAILVHEGSMPLESNSPALTRLFYLAFEAFSQAGHIQIFLPSQRDAVSTLAHLLEHKGFQRVQTHISTLEYRSGTLETRFLAEDMRRLFRTILPFLQKWISVPDDYQAIYQQMLHEVREPDFAAQGAMLSLWGYKPA